MLTSAQKIKLWLTRALVVLFAALLAFVFGPLLARSWRQRVASRRAIDAYLATRQVHRLELGAGGTGKRGWLNTDVEPGPGEVFLDASKPFPLPDGCMRVVHSEHVIEHVHYDAGKVMLEESFRVLEPGGKIRVATPDLVKVAAVLQDPLPAEVARYVAQKADWHSLRPSADAPCLLVNHVMTGFGHRFLYTPKLLRARLGEAGFVDVRQYALGESDDAELRGVEVRSTWPAGTAEAEASAYETMVFEGTKPGAR